MMLHFALGKLLATRQTAKATQAESWRADQNEGETGESWRIYPPNSRPALDRLPERAIFCRESEMSVVRPNLMASGRLVLRQVCF